MVNNWSIVGEMPRLQNAPCMEPSLLGDTTHHELTFPTFLDWCSLSNSASHNPNLPDLISLTHIRHHPATASAANILSLVAPPRTQSTSTPATADVAPSSGRNARIAYNSSSEG
jgi:hypothetical protein